VLSINRGFSAPVTLALEQSQTDRLFLARHDSDAFCRWEALNGLFTQALIAATGKLRDGRKAAFAPELAAIAGEIAADRRLEEAFRALMLSLPSEADIAREIGSDIDPDAIRAAREALAGAIAAADGATFERLIAELHDAGPFRPDATGAGRRALKNILLDYVTLGSNSPALAARQFQTATNMTDRAAALTILAHRFAGSAEADAALAEFERRYGGDALVLDKWFQIQATVPGAETVGRVAKLMQHPRFSIANPNRVRALVGTFGAANQSAFNSADGSGYRLFADAVMEVEKRNPQVAARLATAFRSWRSLEPVRQAAAREALAGIASHAGLSRDLADIVGRTLG
jgi:aminopeptidase N